MGRIILRANSLKSEEKLENIDQFF
jgi:hypothetical protein